MTISVAGDDITFTTTSASQARARSTVTTTDGAVKVSFSFEVQRNPLIFRVGTTAGGQEVVPDMVFEPGVYTITLTPGATTYYIDWYLEVVGKAVLVDFARVAAGTLTMDAPWSEANLSTLRFAQSLNVAYVASDQYEPRAIERRGATSFGIRLYRPSDGPFAAINASDVTLTPGALTGETTLTASGELFRTFDVDTILTLNHTGQYEEVSATALDDTTDAIRVSGTDTSRVFRYDVDFTTGSGVGTIVLERSVGNEKNYVTVATHTSDAANQSYDDDLDNQIVYYRLRCSAYSSGTIAASLTHSQGSQDGVARVVSVDADNQVTVDVLSPFASTDATVYWSWGEWGERYGWPGAVGLFDGRLWWVRGSNYWGSVSDNFESHQIGAADSDAIGRTLTGRIAASRWVKGVERLFVGTTGSEHEVTSGNDSPVITPDTVYSRAKSSRGSMAADAVDIGEDGIAFISKSKQRIYLILNSDGGYRVIDLTRLHPDIAGATGFREIAFQQEPEPRLWCVREDGELAVLLLSGQEEIAAWSRMTATDGTFESVCVVTGTPTDEVYFSVKRTVDGSTVYHTEKLADEDFTDLEDAWRLQCAVEYSGASTTTLTGLDHLEGEDVYVWGNGRQSGPYTVASGQITCDHAVTYAIIGLLYTGRYKGARLDWGANAGTALTQFKKINTLGMIVYRTPGGALKWGPSYTDMATLQDRQSGGFGMDSALQEWTEDMSHPFESSHERDARLHVEMPTAGPATVLGLVPNVETNEKP